MIAWFLNLDTSAQVGIISGIGSSFVIGLIAVLGFWLTFKTSTAALQKSLQLSSQLKIAEFRMKWIDEFRVDLAQLIKTRTESVSIVQRAKGVQKKGQSLSLETIQRRRDLDFESVMLRGRLLLRLKPNSDEPEEAELEKILKTAMELDPEKANTQRRRIVELSRILLKKEWERVKKSVKPNKGK